MPKRCFCVNLGMQTVMAVLLAVTFSFPLYWSQVEHLTENFQLLLQDFTLVTVST